ncbi:glycosyltransferase [bacterium]|nr:glycosyltransferase [bacterium]
MKICDLTQIYSPRGGGVRSYLEAKRKYIRDHTSYDHLMIVPGARTERVEGGRTQLWTVAGPLVNRTSRYRWMLDLPALLRILYEEHPDIVEAGDPYHAAMISRNWANRRGSDFYMFYHSHFPDALLRTVLKFAGTWARGWVERVAGDYLRNMSQNSRGVFVASRHLMRILSGWGLQGLVHLPLGVDTTVFKPEEQRRQEIRGRLKLPPNEPVFLYVGRFSPDKDTALLLRSWIRMAEKMKGPWTGVMVGDGQMTDLVETFVRHNPRVRRVPFVKKPEELADWYRAADLLIHPGRWETFGLVLLEAQACGLPVIGFRGGAMDEQAADLESWAVDRNSAGLADAVMRKAGQLRGVDRERAARFVAERFSWERTFAHQMEVYERKG